MFGLQPLLALVAQPSNLLQRHENLAERGVDERLAAIAGAHSTDGILLLQNKSLNHPQERATRLERTLRPLFLRFRRASDPLSHFIRRHRAHVRSEHAHVPRIVTRHAVARKRRVRVPELPVDSVLLLVRELNDDLRHSRAPEKAQNDGEDEDREPKVALIDRSLRVRERLAHRLRHRNVMQELKHDVHELARHRARSSPRTRSEGSHDLARDECNRVESIRARRHSVARRT